MTRLQNKVAVVTGGAAGIGLAASQLFAREGAKVLLVDIDERKLKEAENLVGVNSASYCVADVTVPEQIKEYCDIAEQRYGGIDIFINNAGIEGETGPITEYSIETFDKVLAVNVRGVWLGLKYMIPKMEKRGGGSIVITSSIAGVSGGAGVSAYSTSKHAVIGIMRSATDECAALGIRVNTVNPGFTETRMMRSLEEQFAPGHGDAVKESLSEQVPLKRYALPEEIAKLMLFLASDESSYCTGSIFMADGGKAKY